MQIQAGLATVTNGSATVVGNASTDWTEALVALQYGSPAYFCLVGVAEVPRQITAVAPPATSASGQWELTLVAPWSDETQENVSYIIHKDFTVNLQLPIVSANDRQVPQLLSRAFEILDTAYVSQNVTFYMPGADQVFGTVNTRVPVLPGKTLIATSLFTIPAGFFLDIRAGGRLQIL
jgi:hypothetical protein